MSTSIYDTRHDPQNRETKPNMTNRTPHGAAVRGMLERYRDGCTELDQMVTRLKTVSDKRSVEEIQSEITTKSAKLAIKQATKRPHLDRAVLEHEITVLRATLAHKKSVADIRSQIAKLETQQQTKSRKHSKDVIALDQEISALKKTLASLEMSKEEQTNLENRIVRLTKNLSSSVGSLMQYSDEFSTRTRNYIELTKKTLNLTPSLGSVIGRGQTGKDVLLGRYKAGCRNLEQRMNAGEDQKSLKTTREELRRLAQKLEQSYGETLNPQQMAKLGIVPTWGK